jgi:hypothetical protein
MDMKECWGVFGILEKIGFEWDVLGILEGM